MPSRDESYTNIAGEQIERAQSVELRRGTVLAGRYQVEAVIGQGGAGLVVRAYDRELQEVVAIKVLRPELGSATRWIERLAREVKLARQIRHPNVCRVFDFQKADGHFFIVMELASGGPLRRELAGAELRSRALGARLADARAVASGLAAIHEAGIAHRDVTPQNVLRMGDGRLVVSDFGLATEISQTTTSIHGGTLAYMAPEVVRGERASFASDLWSLGVVIHEIVFGTRPAWSRPVGGGVLTPPVGRPLAPEERLALQVCRACTADLVERRPRSASEVAAALAGGAGLRTGGRRAGRLTAGLVALVAAGATVMALWSRKSAHPAADARELTELPSQPADLSAAGRVLATVDSRVQCLKVLPDGRTARFVWGHPRRSEDMDLRTGRRTPSPLVPEAYREGCAELSPDGKRLAFEGYTSDGRAFIYLSARPDGRDAIPIVAATDPSVSSEPKWLPDSGAFTFDIDHQHMGLFSLDTRRTIVLPEATNSAYLGSFRFVVGDRLFISAPVSSPYRSEIIELGGSFLTERARFTLPGVTLDLASPGDGTLVATSSAWSGDPLWKVDLARRTRHKIAVVPGQSLRYPSFTKDGLLVASLSYSSDIWLRDDQGALRQITHSGDVADVAPCGRDLIAARIDSTAASSSLVVLDAGGRVLRTLSTNSAEISPGCSPDGREWFTARWSDATGLYHCSDRGCDRLTRDEVGGLTVSPDGQRLAFIQPRKSDPVVAWMPAAGGEPREVSASETGCAPGWTSNRELWVSRKRAGRLAWVELDVDTGRETGRTVPGEKDCADGIPDPASPVHPEVRVVTQTRTQIHLVPPSVLTR
jgi:hypothetical protein